jgi:hypothetical protein
MLKLVVYIVTTMDDSSSTQTVVRRRRHGSAKLSSSHSSHVYRIHLALCDTCDVTAAGVRGYDRFWSIKETLGRQVATLKETLHQTVSEFLLTMMSNISVKC